MKAVLYKARRQHSRWLGAVQALTGMFLTVGMAVLAGCGRSEPPEHTQTLALPALTLSNQVGDADRAAGGLSEAERAWSQPPQSAAIARLPHRGPSLTLSQEELDRQYTEARRALPPPAWPSQ